MNKLKLIITFILLVSLFLGVVACTPDEESKAESSADMSEAVSETASADISTDESEEETNIKLMLQNEEIVTLDKYKDGKELCLVVLTKDDDVIKNDIVDKFNYTAKDILKNAGGNPGDENFRKLVADVGTLLPDYRQDMIDELVAKYDLDTDDAFLEDKFIFRFDEEVTWAWSSDINEYYVYILVYLDDSEAENIQKDYRIEFFGKESFIIEDNYSPYYFTYPYPLPE